MFYNFTFKSTEVAMDQALYSEKQELYKINISLTF